MINVGHINAAFSVKAHGLDVTFDPAANEQYLTFKFALTASLPQLLQQLLDFQQTSEQQGTVAQASPLSVFSQQPPGLQHVSLPTFAATQTHPGLVSQSGLLSSMSAAGPAQQPPQMPPPSLQQVAGAFASPSAPLSHLQQQQQQQQQQAAKRQQGPPVQPPQSQQQQLPPQSQPQQQQQQQQQQQASMQPQASMQQVQRSPPSQQPQQQPPAVPPGSQLNQVNAQGQAPSQPTPNNTGMQAQASQQQQQQQQAMQSQSSGPSGGQAAASNPQLNTAFMEALTSDNMQLARTLLNQRADVNFVDASKRTPLFHILEAGGKVDHVNLLLKAKANVNATITRGKTPLHLAIQNYMNIPPLVIRMLLCSQADLHTPDARGVTPLDCVWVIHTAGVPAADDPSMRVRQLLNEVTETPTVDIVIPAEGQRIQNAFFTDVNNEKIVFNTESSIGLYSLLYRRLLFFKKLKQQVASTVKNIAVNPEFGTVAVCIELAEMQGEQVVGRQNVFIVWPNGQLQDEEPLKLSIKIENIDLIQPEPACVMLSHCQGTQMLLGRLVDGKIFCWHLNSARSQLVSEHELVKNGGRLAISDNGHWIAVCRNEEPKRVSIFTYEDGEGNKRMKPIELLSLPKNPQAMAVQQTADSVATCYVAFAEGQSAEGALAPIEVISFSIDGSYKTMYRLQCPSPCHTLSFCHRTCTYLLSGHQDGLVVLNDLLSGAESFCHDDPGISFLSICTDRSLVVSTQDNYFRVFKVPAADSAAT